jgi:hypothetical protein
VAGQASTELAAEIGLATPLVDAGKAIEEPGEERIVDAARSDPRKVAERARQDSNL